MFGGLSLAQSDLGEQEPEEEFEPDLPEAGGLEPWQPTLGERIGEAWAARDLLWMFAVRIVPTYHGRVLGRAWVVIRPLMQVTGFGVVLGGVFNATAPNGTPYILFMIMSMQAFRMFEQTVIYETLSSRMVRPLTRGLRIPLLLVPVAAMFRAIVELAIFWSFAAVVLVYYVVTSGHFYLVMSPKLVLGFAGLALCLLFGFAIGLTTSALYPRVPDVRYVARYVLQFWLFFTPVFYSLDSLSHRTRMLAEVNPLTPLVGLVQYGFLGSGTIHPAALAWGVGVLVAVGAFGLWFFNRNATKWIALHAVPDEDDDQDEELF